MIMYIIIQEHVISSGLIACECMNATFKPSSVHLLHVYDCYHHCVQYVQRLRKLIVFAL